MKWAFFGTPDIAVAVLHELSKSHLKPDLIVSAEDAPVGRKQILTSPPVAQFAKKEHLPLLQPNNFKDETGLEVLTKNPWDIFVVFAYGKILPSWLINLPKHGTINLHPSLLPKLRGASPIRSAILNNEFPTGVTIILMDEQMDHGPILTQETLPIAVDQWPMEATKLEDKMAVFGGQLLAKTILGYINGDITPKAQNHHQATFCQKISKDMAQIDLDPYNLPKGDLAQEYLRKIYAFAGWPEAFFIHNGKCIKIRSGHIQSDSSLCIEKIVPEGKSEMDFSNYFRPI